MLGFSLKELPTSQGPSHNLSASRLWESRSVEKSQNRLFHSAWKSRNPSGISTSPQPRRRPIFGYISNVATITPTVTFLNGLTGPQRPASAAGCGEEKMLGHHGCRRSARAGPKLCSTNRDKAPRRRKDLSWLSSATEENKRPLAKAAVSPNRSSEGVRCCDISSVSIPVSAHGARVSGPPLRRVFREFSSPNSTPVWGKSRYLYALCDLGVAFFWKVHSFIFLSVISPRHHTSSKP